MQRREFLGLSGFALLATALSGCSGGASTGPFQAASSASFTPPPLTVSESLVTAFAPNGDYHVLSRVGNTVTRFNSAGQQLWQRAEALDGTGLFTGPTDAHALVDGSVVVLDLGGARIHHFDAANTLLASYGTVGLDAGEFLYPKSIALGPDGLVYACCPHVDAVLVFNTAGTLQRTIGGAGSTLEVHDPIEVTFDPAGRLHVLQARDNAVRVFSTNGVLLATYGDLEISGRALGMAIYADGSVAVSSTAGFIYFFTPSFALRGAAPVVLSDGRTAYADELTLRADGHLFAQARPTSA